MTDEFEVRRTTFLARLQPGDFVNWNTFDGSSVHEVHSVTDDEIVLCRPDGTPGTRWPRNGFVHRDAYGGYDEYLGPPGPPQLEYFLFRRYRRALLDAIKGMNAKNLRMVTEFAVEVAAGSIRRTHTAQELRHIADLLDAGEDAFRALERITGQPAPLSGGSEVQDTLRAMAEDRDRGGSQ
ncbi:MAG: hypothetical protein ACYCV7_11190 [Acidimicrobiales bacterium]